MLNQAWHFSISFFLILHRYIDVIIEQVILHTYRPRCCRIELQLKSDLAKKKARLANSTDCCQASSQSFIHNSHWISFDLGDILSKKDLRIFLLHSKDTKNPVIKLSRPVNLHFALPLNIEAVAEGSTMYCSCPREPNGPVSRPWHLRYAANFAMYGTYM